MAEIDQTKKEADDFGRHLELWKPRLSAYLPTQIKPDRVISLALHAVTKGKGLLECNRHSVITAVVGAMQMGLELHTPLNHAYLIPFKDKTRGKIAQLVIGYPGYIELMHRSGKVEMIDCRVVYSGDDFNYALGTNCYIEHRPGPVEERGNITHFYAIVWLKGSQRPLVEVMPAEDVNAIRDRSASYRTAEKYHKHDSPWHTDYDIMGRKTVLKRIQKWSPKSSEMALAIELDNAAEAGQEQFNHIDLGDIDPETDDGGSGSGVQKLKDKLTNGQKANGDTAPPINNQAAPEDDQTPPDEPSPDPPEAGPESGEGSEEEKKTAESKDFQRDIIKLDPVCRNKLCPNKGTGLGTTVDPHHLVKRSQGGDYSVGNGLGLCRHCHDLVENGGEFRGETLPGKQIELEILEQWLYTDDWRWDEAYEQLHKREP